MGYNLDQENEKGDYSEGAKDRREDRSGRKRVVTVITSRVTPLALVSTTQKMGGYLDRIGCRSTMCDGTTEDKTMRGYRRSTSIAENVVGKGEGGRRY